MRTKVRWWLSWRRSYAGYWTLAEERIPSDLRARLKTLRGCETRGIAERDGPGADYRYDGHHDGAYQYTPSTWQRAQDWYPRRVPGWTSYAYDASPDHQDAVTAAFFPYHEGEWACPA